MATTEKRQKTISSGSIVLTVEEFTDEDEPLPAVVMEEAENDMEDGEVVDEADLEDGEIATPGRKAVAMEPLQKKQSKKKKKKKKKKPFPERRQEYMFYSSQEENLHLPPPHFLPPHMAPVPPHMPPPYFYTSPPNGFTHLPPNLQPFHPPTGPFGVLGYSTPPLSPSEEVDLNHKQEDYPRGKRKASSELSPLNLESSSEPTIDLASLRAAALRTKASVDPSPEKAVADENDVEKLRFEVLKSMNSSKANEPEPVKTDAMKAPMKIDLPARSLSPLPPVTAYVQRIVIPLKSTACSGNRAGGDMMDCNSPSSKATTVNDAIKELKRRIAEKERLAREKKLEKERVENGHTEDVSESLCMQTKLLESYEEALESVELEFEEAEKNVQRLEQQEARIKKELEELGTSIQAES